MMWSALKVKRMLKKRLPGANLLRVAKGTTNQET